MNWYPNASQLLGLNLNSYTNLTLQNHIAQRGLSLPFQLNQFQGKSLNLSVLRLIELNYRASIRLNTCRNYFQILHAVNLPAGTRN